MALGSSTAQAAGKCEIGVSGELPVTMRGQRPIITAQINGAPVTFIADSGAFYSSITTAVASALKLSQRSSNLVLKGVSGEARAGLTTVKDFNLAGYRIPNIEFIVTQSLGGDIGGLLGQNILGAADVEYDLPHGMIRILVPKNCGRNTGLAYWAADRDYAYIDLKDTTPSQPHTIGTVEVNGVKLRALFDTGASLSSLTMTGAARLGIKPDTPGVETLGVATGGIGARPIRSWIARVSSFKIDNEAISNTRIRFSDFELGDADMLIGADFFLSHRVYVSKAQRRLYATYEGGKVFDLTSQARAPTEPNRAEPAGPGKAAPQPALANLADAEAHVRRGAVAESRRDYKAALADFDKAVELKPDNAGYLFRRAGAHRRLGQSALAKSDLDRALALDPKHLDSLAARAALRLAAKDRPGAKADIDTAARLAARDADIRISLAEAYNELGLLEAAIAQDDLWLETHARDPLRFQALNSRCWSRALLGRDLQAALADCNRALEINRAVHILDSRGMVHFRLGAYDKAIADYDAVLKESPELAWSLYGRGLAKLAKGLKGQGEADLAAAAKIDPDLAEEARGYGIVVPAATGAAVR